MIIGNIEEKDILFIHDLQPDGWPNIIPVIQFYIKNSKWCNPVKVKINNHLVGIGCAISLKKTGWLAHIIVDPDYRKQGIGSFIVDYLCKHLKNMGVETISLIATEFGYPVYKKAGFIDETEYVFFEKKDSLTFNITENIISFETHYIDKIFNLDRMVSGEERSNLLNMYLKNSYLYVQNNNFYGFYIPDLGEGLIIAENIEAGIELMKLRYLKNNKGVLPIDNLNAIQFLKDNGFSEIKRAKRMIMGNKYKWNPQAVFNRIAGNFG